MITHPLMFACAVTALVALLTGFLIGWAGARAHAKAGNALRTQITENPYTATKIGV